MNGLREIVLFLVLMVPNEIPYASRDVEWIFLQDFFIATNGDSWKNNSNWAVIMNSSNNSNYATYSNPCEVVCYDNIDIHEVSCNCNVNTTESLHIIELSFTNNNLNGTVPENIDNLNHLKSFIIDTEMLLVGTIPQTIYSIDTMETFKIISTALEGNITASNNFSDWKNSLIEYIMADNSNIDDSLYVDHPFWLHLPKLKKLYFQSMDNLRIELGNDNLCNFKQIENIGLVSLIHINGTMPDSCICESWKHLYGINIGAWPEYGNAHNAYNVSGTINSCFGQIAPNLNFVIILGTSIGGEIFSDNNCRWNKSIYIWIDYNQFNGTISQSCMSGIFQSAINYHNGNVETIVQGSIPYLSIQYNNFTGSLPSNIDISIVSNNLDMTSIYGLMLSHNQFTGTIPEYLTKYKYRLIYINDNEFTGSIPSDFFCNSYLTQFHASNNRFTKLPSIPDYCNFSIPQLNFFSAGNNNFEERNIGVWLNKIYNTFAKLETLLLSDNGDISGDISNWNTAYSGGIIALHNCDLYGTINEHLTKYNVKFITLIGNRISGLLPNDFTNASMIRNETYPGYVILGNYFTVKNDHGKWFLVDFLSAPQLYLTPIDIYYSYGYCVYVVISYVIIILFKCKSYTNKFSYNSACFRCMRKEDIHKKRKMVARKTVMEKELMDSIFHQSIDSVFTIVSNPIMIICSLSLSLIYYNFSNYYAQGKPISHFSLMYFMFTHDQETKTRNEICIFLIIIYCVINMNVLFNLYKLKQMMDRYSKIDTKWHHKYNNKDFNADDIQLSVESQPDDDDIDNSIAMFTCMDLFVSVAIFIFYLALYLTSIGLVIV